MFKIIKETFSFACALMAVVFGAMFLFNLNPFDAAHADEVHLKWQNSADLTPDQKERVKNALLAACPKLLMHWRDVVDTSARLKKAGPMRQREYGWQQFIQIKIMLSDDTKTFPRHVRAWGHTLWFDMGGGDRPGVMGMKTQGEYACNGTSVGDDRNWFADTSEASFISSL